MPTSTLRPVPSGRVKGHYFAPEPVGSTRREAGLPYTCSRCGHLVFVPWPRVIEASDSIDAILESMTTNPCPPG